MEGWWNGWGCERNILGVGGDGGVMRGWWNGRSMGSECGWMEGCYDVRWGREATVTSGELMTFGLDCSWMSSQNCTAQDW